MLLPKRAPAGLRALPGAFFSLENNISNYLRRPEADCTGGPGAEPPEYVPLGTVHVIVHVATMHFAFGPAPNANISSLAMRFHTFEMAVICDGSPESLPTGASMEVACRCSVCCSVFWFAACTEVFSCRLTEQSDEVA